MAPKILAVTGGDAATPLLSALPQLIDAFASFQNLSIRILNGNPEDGLLHETFQCDRITGKPCADLGAKIVNACREIDWLLIDVGRDLSKIHVLATFLGAARVQAEKQGRSALAFLPVAFGGSPSVIQMPSEEIGVLAENGFKVRPAVFADRTRRKGHTVCSKSKSVIGYGSIPPLGKGLADLIQRDGPTLSGFLARTPPGFGFAANHIRSWLNHCIDWGVFDDIIANDQLVPGTNENKWEHSIRRGLKYQFDRVATIAEAHDDELFTRYHRHWADSRAIMANAD